MRNIMSKLVVILSFVLIAAVSASYWQLAVAGTDSQAIKSGLNYLRAQQETTGKILGFGGSTDWAAMAFAANGVDLSSVTSGGNSLVDFLENNPPESDAAATDWARATLAVVAVGKDPNSFGGVNYVQKVESLHTSGQLGNPDQLNDDIFGLLSLIAAGSGSSSIKSDTLSFIISNQNTDGGFSWSTAGSSDLDDTGAAIQALKAAQQNGLSASGLSDAIEKAKTFILINQNSDGGFPHLPPGDSNTSSTAWVVMGLNSLGLGSNSQALKAIDYTKSNQKADGSFAWQPTVVAGDTLTTSYALMALSGKFWPTAPASTTLPQEPKETPKQETPEQPKEKQQPNSSEPVSVSNEITARVKITGSSGTVFDDKVSVSDCSITDKEGKTHTFSEPFAICALDAAAQMGDFSYTAVDFGGNLGLFVETIEGDTTTEDFSSFWTYNINSKQAELGVSNLVVKDGDFLEFIYEQGLVSQSDDQSSESATQTNSSNSSQTSTNQTTSTNNVDRESSDGQVLSAEDQTTTVGKTAGELSQLPNTGPGLIAILASLSALVGIVLRKFEKFIKLNRIPQMKSFSIFKLNKISGKNHLFLAIVMVIGAVLLRVVPHMPNFAPITATALFGGAYLPKRLALIIPFVAMAISDYLLLYVNPFGGQLFNFSQLHPVTSMFHSTTIFVYGSFFVSLLLGMWLKTHKRVDNVIWITLLASVQFFLITNFGVWAGGMYSRGIDGLFQSYLMGLPFFRWTLLGDLFYTVTFFAAFEFSLKLAKKPRFALAKQYN